MCVSVGVFVFLFRLSIPSRVQEGAARERSSSIARCPASACE